MNKRTKSVVGAVSAVGVAVAGAAAGYAAAPATATPTALTAPTTDFVRLFMYLSLE